jgi:hypothetical protein
MIALRTLGLPLALAAGLTAAGCVVETEHSIVDKPLPPDKRLDGVWAMESSGNALVLVLYRADDNAEALSASFVIVDKREVHTSRANVQFTSIGGRPYFEVRWVIGEWLPLDPPVRQGFGTWMITGTADSEMLQLCFADPVSFEAAMKSGGLKGFLGEGKSYERRAVISNGSAELRAHLAMHHFTCRVSATYRRVSGPAQSR